MSAAQLWAIDSGTPAVGPLAVEADGRAPAPMRTALRRARPHVRGTGIGPRVVAGDFTGDGKTDVGVFYNYNNANTSVAWWVFKSNGSGGARPAP